MFSYAVACSCNNTLWRVDYLFDMRINYVFHVGHSSVVYFNVVTVRSVLSSVLLHSSYNDRLLVETFEKQI